MTIITKKPSKLLVPRSRINEVRVIASTYSQQDSSTVTNGMKAIMQFDNIESDPIWLLDLRRSGIPYVWFWGVDALKWRYADASVVENGRGHTAFNAGSDNGGVGAFKIACGDFVNFEFEPTPAIMSHSLSQASLLMA